jgi:hypothetical protein
MASDAKSDALLRDKESLLDRYAGRSTLRLHADKETANKEILELRLRNATVSNEIRERTVMCVREQNGSVRFEWGLP